MGGSEQSSDGGAEHGWQSTDGGHGGCLSPLNTKLSLIGCGYSWVGDHLGIAVC